MTRSNEWKVPLILRELRFYFDFSWNMICSKFNMIYQVKKKYQHRWRVARVRDVKIGVGKSLVTCLVILKKKSFEKWWQIQNINHGGYFIRKIFYKNVNFSPKANNSVAFVNCSFFEFSKAQSFTSKLYWWQISVRTKLEFLHLAGALNGTFPRRNCSI